MKWHKQSQQLCALRYPLLEPTEKHLFFLDDVDAGFHVGESMRGGEHSLALELLVKLAMCSPVPREGSAEHKGPQIVVLVEVRDAVLQFIGVKERFHVSQLDVCLG